VLWPLTQALCFQDVRERWQSWYRTDWAGDGSQNPAVSAVMCYLHQRIDGASDATTADSDGDGDDNSSNDMDISSGGGGGCSSSGSSSS
jgi:hypothetical protein